MKKEEFYLKLNVHNLSMPYDNKVRRIRVLLPKNYEFETENYPVVYFHDGQNVFYSKEAFIGHSWKIIPTIKKNENLKKMIIVGIDNDGENRLNEYTPWEFEKNLSNIKNLKSSGDNYSKFLVEVVKPFIDSNYRTKKEAKYTALIGSSLGANISQYMGLKYSNIFSNLGIFSSAMWLSPNSFNNYLEKINIDINQKIYIQVGTNESNKDDDNMFGENVSQIYIDTSLDYYNKLLEKGFKLENIKLRIVASGKHSETVWAKYLYECLEFFSRSW